MPAAVVDRFIALLESGAPNLEGTGIDANQWNGSPQVTSADATLYQSALDDAQRKAQAIAQHLSERLSAPRSIVEFNGATGAAPELPAPAPAGIVEKVAIAPRVLIAGNRSVALAVTYGLSDGGTVSVFGLGNAAEHGAAQGVMVNVNANAPTMQRAQQRLNGLVRYVDQTAHRFNVPASAVSISNMSFNR